MQSKPVNRYRPRIRPRTSLPVTFTKKETDYIRSQHLARIGTASKRGDPDVAAVSLTSTKKTSTSAAAP